MDGGMSIEWEATSDSLACRLPEEIPEEILRAIRVDFLAALRGMGIPSRAVEVTPPVWVRYGYRMRTIMIIRSPLPTSLQSEQSPMRRLLHNIVAKHLNS